MPDESTSRSTLYRALVEAFELETRLYGLVASSQSEEPASSARRGSDDGTQDAARPVDPRPWLSSSRLAPSGCAGRRHAVRRALRAQRADRRARQTRHD